MSCFLDGLTHSFIPWWIKLHTSEITAPLIYMSVQYIRAEDGSWVILCFIPSELHVMLPQWSSACVCCRQSGIDRCGWGRVKLSAVLALVQWGGSFKVYQRQLWDEPYPRATRRLSITDQHQRRKQISSHGSLLGCLVSIHLHISHHAAEIGDPWWLLGHSGLSQQSDSAT